MLCTMPCLRGEAEHRGRYRVAPCLDGRASGLAIFLFFPDSGPQFARSGVSGINVVGDPPNGPRAVGFIPAQTLTVGGGR